MHLDLVWNIYYGQFELNVKPEFKVVQKMFIISARKRGQESVGGLPWWLCNTSVVTNSHEVWPQKWSDFWPVNDPALISTFPSLISSAVTLHLPLLWRCQVRSQTLSHTNHHHHSLSGSSLDILWSCLSCDVLLVCLYSLHCTNVFMVSTYLWFVFCVIDFNNLNNQSMYFMFQFPRSKWTLSSPLSSIFPGLAGVFDSVISCTTTTHSYHGSIFFRKLSVVGGG